MKTKTLRFIAVGAALAGGAWCWWLLGMAAEAPDGKRVRGWTAVPELKVPVRPVVKWPKRDTGAFRKLVLERTGSWLEGRGRDAAGLVAVWDMTGDLGLLLEAWQQFPDDVRVCAVLVAYGRIKGVEGQKMAERVIAAEPENPYGYFLKVQALRGSKDRDGILAVLEQAVRVKGKYDDYSRQRAGLVREAALAAGMGEAALARLLFDKRIMTYGPFDRFGSRQPGSVAGDILMNEMKKAAAAVEESRMTKLAGLGMAVAERFVSGGPGTLMNASYANYLESVMLEPLPGEMEIGTEGQTVAKRREEVRVRGEALETASKRGHVFYVHMDDADDGVVLAYAGRFLEHGEEVALGPLLNEPSPVKKESETKKTLQQAGEVYLRTFLIR